MDSIFGPYKPLEHSMQDMNQDTQDPEFSTSSTSDPQQKTVAPPGEQDFGQNSVSPSQQDSGQDDPSTCILFRLPPEIRELIYEHFVPEIKHIAIYIFSRPFVRTPVPAAQNCFLHLRYHGVLNNQWLRTNPYDVHTAIRDEFVLFLLRKRGQFARSCDTGVTIYTHNLLAQHSSIPQERYCFPVSLGLLSAVKQAHMVHTLYAAPGKSPDTPKERHRRNLKSQLRLLRPVAQNPDINFNWIICVIKVDNPEWFLSGALIEALLDLCSIFTNVPCVQIKSYSSAHMLLKARLVDGRTDQRNVWLEQLISRPCGTETLGNLNRQNRLIWTQRIDRALFERGQSGAWHLVERERSAFSQNVPVPYWWEEDKLLMGNDGLAAGS